MSRNNPFGPLLLGAVLLFSSCTFDALESKTLAIRAIELRCARDGAFSTGDCKKLAKDTVEAAHYEVDAESGSLAFLADDLIRLLQMPSVRTYLKELAREIEQNGAEPFDLWAWSVPRLGSPELVEDVLTVVVQDHIHPYHVAWLRFVHAHAETVSDLESVMRGLGNRGALGRIRFYSPEVTDAQIAAFNEKIYYYYLPKRLHRRLVARGWTAERARAWMVYVILAYKMHHHFERKSDALWREHPLDSRDGFASMSEQERNAWRYRLRDAYMGYVATGGRAAFTEFFDAIVW